MSSDSKTTANVVITGDITMDWNLARVNRGADKELTWNPDDSTFACWQRGGAALLADLISVIAQDLMSGSKHIYSISQSSAPTKPVDPSNPVYHHSYALWSRYEDQEQTAWRVSEFLGLDRSLLSTGKPPDWLSIVDEPAHVDYLLIDDAAMGFRDHPEFWPRCLQDPKNRPWVLLKMSHPVGKGALWEHLLEHYSDRLVLLTTVSDLRRTEVQISKGLSWERTAQDVAWELRYNPQINQISQCTHVVVSFGAAGAVIQTNNSPGADADESASSITQLVFAPEVIEGEWENHLSGGMIGYTTCLAAGIARHWMQSPDSTNIIQGVLTGLKAIRHLHLEGYDNKGSPDEPRITFPLNRISQQLAISKHHFAVIDVPDPVKFLTDETRADDQSLEAEFWSILRERYQGDLEDVCERIILEGAETVLVDVPQGIFGKLFTVDRQEIESFRAIKTLTSEYLNHPKPERPLSIAVFGAPGSGKSFGITQVAESLAPKRIKVLEFNLSQFESTDELCDALHQVRDVNLSGMFPLVFWDEFDTTLSGNALGWLRYFLAPMQDGEFREGQIVHPIGPAIFVFAGGTSKKMASFGAGLDKEAFRNRKVPDFISRLKGFVNILGLNPQENGKPSQEDSFYMIRRAIIFRSLLWRNARHLFQQIDGIQVPNIDQGVLRAFLKIRFYKHGIRSMESIITMSQLAGNTKFERSCLPPELQLDLHVDGQEFLALVQQIELTNETLEKLAILYHQYFCALLEKQGYMYGKETDDEAKTHSSLIDFYTLPEEEQEQNRDTVRQIRSKLAASGYIMIPERANEPDFEFPETFLDELAKLEHERWVRMKLAEGWQEATVTDKEYKLHQDMVPWEQLSELAKNKDRNLVKAIPKILAAAGYTVVKLRPTKTDH